MVDSCHECAGVSERERVDMSDFALTPCINGGAHNWQDTGHRIKCWYGTGTGQDAPKTVPIMGVAKCWLCGVETQFKTEEKGKQVSDVNAALSLSAIAAQKAAE